MPKSGSTYLSTIIENLPLFDRAHLVPGYDRREQELDYLALIKNNDRNYVAQHHVKYSSSMQSIISQFSIKPIVLRRNIFDACISLRDHMRKESPIGSMGYADSTILQLSDPELELFIATHFIPWYFNFHLSWNESKEKLDISYKDILESPFRTVEKVLTYSGSKIAPESIEKAIQLTNRQHTRKNKAIAARGKQLSSKATEKIYELASFYKDFDLSQMGIKH